jgi:hypothetical protein
MIYVAYVDDDGGSWYVWLVVDGQGLGRQSARCGCGQLIRDVAQVVVAVGQGMDTL